MKKQDQKQIVDIEAFNDVSLWQLIPSGRGLGLSLLKTIVNAIHNGDFKLRSLLIVGHAGLRTHGSAFIRALGIEKLSQIDGSLLPPGGELVKFFNSDKDQAFLITNADELTPMLQLPVYKIITTNKYQLYNHMKQGYESFDVPGLIVMTSKNIKDVADPIVKSVDSIVEIENYRQEQLRLIILQRLVYAHIGYENDDILKNIVLYGNNDLKQTIKFLKICIAVMQSDGRRKLLLDDVEKAKRLSPPPVPAPPISDDIPF